MSKDKYRPSITDKEVVATSDDTELPPLTGGTLTPPGRDPLTDLPPGDGGVGKNAPTGLRVVSQRAYYSPEGHQYVEVVFEWDSTGANEYLLRVAV